MRSRRVNARHYRNSHEKLAIALRAVKNTRSRNDALTMIGRCFPEQGRAALLRGQGGAAAPPYQSLAWAWPLEGRALNPGGGV